MNSRSNISSNTLFCEFQVTLKGAKDCVEAARNRILQTVGDLDSQVTIECNMLRVQDRRFTLILHYFLGQKETTTINDNGNIS